jgi:hypothetical protein
MLLVERSGTNESDSDEASDNPKATVRYRSTPEQKFGIPIN